MTIDTSVVIPGYGSERILPDLVRRLGETLMAMHDNDASRFEVIIVNDCSPDGLWDGIVAQSATLPRLKGIDLRKNAGQHNAVLTGLRFARGRRIVMMDDDLQHDPADIPKVVAVLDSGHDVCYARFRSRQHALWKRMGSRFNSLVADRLLSKPRELYLSPFKGIVRGIRDEMVRFTGPHVYLDGLIIASTNDIAMIDLDHFERPDGKSGYSLRKSISLWLKMATSFSIEPLRIASLLGLLFSGLGFVLAVALIIIRFTLNAMPVGWSSLIVSILILGGIQLLALGIIGEYVGRVLLHVNGRPQAVVGETTNMDRTDA
jgi:undecaprenyl-phosphate 4-deoxy-4-formamido-L-arabinose transferase